MANEPLKVTLKNLQALDDWTPGPLHDVIDRVAAELEVGMGKVAQPLRVALTGAGVSPSIDKTLWLTGRDRSLARIARALEYVLIRAAAQ